MFRRMHINHIVFVGKNKKPASIYFGKGLNVIVGPSNSGKSFVSRVIDYMLGGETLVVPREGKGYEHVLMGVTLSSGKERTLIRSVSGGDFFLSDGLTEVMPDARSCTKLGAKHAKNKKETVSNYLLEEMGIAGAEVIKNAKNEKRAITIRSLARIILPSETKLQEDISPIYFDGYTAATSEARVFNYLLTGQDDNGVIVQENEDQAAGTAASVLLLEKIISDKKKSAPNKLMNVAALHKKIEELKESIKKNEYILRESQEATEGLVNKYYDLAQEENDAAEKIRDLKSTVDRFKILMDFYKSDKERLGAISEAGILFLSIDKDKCFFCGSSQENHAKHEAFDKNVPMIQAAAQNELGKISLMEKDLEDAIKKLLSKVDSFKKSLTSIQIDRAALKGQIENKRQLRISILDQYNQQIQQRQDATIALLNTQELNKLYQIQQEITPSAIATDNQTSKVQKTAGELLEKLSLEIESALKKWAFPLNGRVAFNTKDYDITVGGKPRKDNGKGVKAILHSAFSVGLMSYCFKEKTPHPGLLVLDSPLVTYDPAKSTGKKEFNADIRDEFFRHLEDKFKNAQVIVIDNRKCVPSWVDKLKNTTVFTLRHSAKERYGFFPVEK